jgi:hypothetical protein
MERALSVEQWQRAVLWTNAWVDYRYSVSDGKRDGEYPRHENNKGTSVVGLGKPIKQISWLAG